MEQTTEDWVVFGFNCGDELAVVLPFVICVTLRKAIIRCDNIEETRKGYRRLKSIPRYGPVVRMESKFLLTHLLKYTLRDLRKKF